MPSKRPSGKQQRRSIEMRRSAAGTAGSRPAEQKSNKEKKKPSQEKSVQKVPEKKPRQPLDEKTKKAILIAVGLLALLILGTVMICSSFTLPREQDTPAPEQYRQEQSMSPENTSGIVLAP
jgi:Flp pilus assembly protein TadB